MADTNTITELRVIFGKFPDLRKVGKGELTEILRYEPKWALLA